ncbi:MAG TPA: GDSL-type esterase/lipase family protein [Pyrinomonadaceae bacterium]|nr:GDSL-type esterase/lipase family protein [Pyrinomonadaceae bacterium]
MVCKVCATQLRAGAKFCNKCGVPLSLIERFGAKLAGSKSEMTVVGGAQVPEDDDVTTVDSPRLAPTLDPSVGSAPPAPAPSTRLAPTVDPALAQTVDVAGRPPIATPPPAAPPVSPKPPASQVPPVLAQRIAAPPVASPAIVQTADSPVLKRKGPRHILLSKPAQTILFVFIFASLPLFIPELGNMLGLKETPYSDLLPDPRELITFKSSGGSNADAGIGGGGSTATEETTIAATGTDDPVIVGSKNPVEDPARAMDNFYASLALTDAKQRGAVTRVTHYGDSPITNDGITSTVRRLLQENFGDAGHGFILMDRPWAWYGHQAITFTSGGGWDDNPMGPGSNAGGEFGLGGVSFTASGPGKYSRFAPATEGATGKNFSRMEVYYLLSPGGGQFSVNVNGDDSQTISTDGASTTSGFYEIKARQPGENTFEVKSASGSVRLFGAVIENDGPGVVYDSLGVNGAYAGLLATAMNAEHWAEQLRHRNPNLVVINYGTNESQYASDDQMQRYEKDLREVIRRVRVALPTVSILVVSPMDRGKRVPGGKIVTMPSIPKIVEMQRRVALEENVAFFNTFQAMGGEGTMAKWAAGKGKNHLVGGDLTHPTAEGAEVVGRLIYEGIADGYAKYKARAGRTPTQGK